MIIAAKDYLQQQFPRLADVTDAEIQRQLWQQMRVQAASSIAEICLRCYVSNQIYQVCFDLGAKFGRQNGFTYQELLPLVLADEVLLTTQTGKASSYESLATTILKTYNPDKGSLNTWISRYVKQHPDIKRFLLQHGVFLVSDWALLNDTNPKELGRILTQMYRLPALEISCACELLVSYHAVYRSDRLQQRLKGSTLPCQAPTDEQLSRIGQDLQARTSKSLSNDTILMRLQSIGAKLRRYRIAAQGGAIKTLRYDQPEIQPMVEREATTLDNQDQEENEFIKIYQQQLVESLDQSLSEVIEEFINKMQRRRPSNVEALLKGLKLFHCRGESMTQIAPQIGLTKQYEVTRLLKLNELRADVRQRLLNILRTKVIDIAKQFTNIEQLHLLDQKIEEALQEQITKIIEQAESEGRNPVRNQPLRSLFAHRLCLYLDQRANPFPISNFP
ncbi:MAG: hypothetical protein IGS39_04020 [Calothrix sp. C42_A2020_038]|nr:hypothetical protein [Calothrix sp. C42_A2020_038]